MYYLFLQQYIVCRPEIYYDTINYRMVGNTKVLIIICKTNKKVVAMHETIKQLVDVVRNDQIYRLSHYSFRS